jgi:hypothetical protein
VQERFEDIKEVTRSRTSKKTDNIMAKGKLTKGQTVIYKTLLRKLKIEQLELYKEQGRRELRCPGWWGI